MAKRAERERARREKKKQVWAARDKLLSQSEQVTARTTNENANENAGDGNDDDDDNEYDEVGALTLAANALEAEPAAGAAEGRLPPRRWQAGALVGLALGLAAAAAAALKLERLPRL